jgi:hypothetical protein
MAGVYALLVDKNWFLISDTLREVNSFVNAKALTQNFYLHIWQILSVSAFANACIFGEAVADEHPTVNILLESIAAKFLDENGNAVTTYTRGDTVDFVVVSTGTITPQTEGFIVPDAFTTEITIVDGAGKPVVLTSRTYVDRLGRLYVQGDVTAGSVITVTATSTYVDPSGDGSKPTVPVTDTATLTVV